MQNQTQTPQLQAMMLRKVPRYTSYPTANHFRGLREGEGPGFMGGLAPQTPVSLYLHIPFCREICAYCGCTTKASKKDGPISNYVASLVSEIAAKTADFKEKQPVSMISWGGGTPGLLGDSHFAMILSALEHGFRFDELDEHAIEIDPRSFSAEKAAVLAAYGINRISFGVQDLNRQVQHAIGRIQPFEMLQNSAEWARDNGITQLNFDLMYGLPGQTEARLEKTILQSLTLDPSRIALFGYAHMPSLRKNQRMIDEALLPTAPERLAQSDLATKLLLENGFVQIGFDHFAKPDDPMALALTDGTLKRNFQGYSKDGADVLIGFGASAISTLPGGYAQNTSDTKLYMTEVANGKSTWTRGVATDEDDKRRRQIINALLCQFEVDLAAFMGNAPCIYAAFGREMQLLSEYAAANLINITGSRLSILPQGRIFARLVASVFDTYLPEHVTNHAVAV